MKVWVLAHYTDGEPRYKTYDHIELYRSEEAVMKALEGENLDEWEWWDKEVEE